MTEPRLEYVMCASPSGVHRMAYWEWGDAGNDKVLVCVHGLTRCGRDFDELAGKLAAHYRVVCPDVVGRGRSDWLVDPSAYTVPQYISDMLTLIARLDVEQVDWLGTSMGGLIGLGLAGALAMSALQRPQRGEFGLPAARTVRLGKVVLNDIGPRLDAQGIARIAGYVGSDVSFDTFDEAVAYVQSVSAGFGPHSQALWKRLTRDMFNQQDGRWIRHYDLRLAAPMALQDEAALKAAEFMLWSAYDSLALPVLLLRGEESDVLSRETADEMLARNGQAQLVEFHGVGHAPTLLTEEQIAPIERFLCG
ncbi:alpha/beta fold hydrolase [Pusillimonas noertemannii]|uniref:alpha/beta fold hydrolase n=1 Tax=Pusillimonas noertemannii TaxID=305977 RepID=UPI0004753C39|nr:alpha/beta hydrolase [Pusillimonas noertemannii]